MREETKFLPLPQPDEISIREKEDAMGAYLMMFASIAAGLPFPIINLIASIIYFYINKAKSRFVLFHAFQSLVSQIPVTILNAALVFWAIRIFFFEPELNDPFKGYLTMVIIANIIYFIFSLIGAFRARKGRFFYFIFFGRLSYQYAYNAGKDIKKEAPSNVPPKM